MAARFFLSVVRETRASAGSGRAPLRFHESLPGYVRTPLRPGPGLAARLGVAEVWVKDESERLGLPAFKILGASWAVRCALAERLPGKPPATFDELAERAQALRPLALTAATDGNHGRAVAHMARLLGFEARIFVPADMVAARIEAIESEGATVTVVQGGYDEAVARSAAAAGERCLVVSDTSWPGYEDVPRAVIEGYSTILWEVADELAERGAAPPDLVAVQVGVGALAAAVAGHYRGPGRPRIVAVEPERAACVLASMEAGRVVTIPGPQDSIMSGLNCGTPSIVAWPTVSTGIDLYLAVADERAREAMRLLAAAGIVAGETGAAGLAGLLELVEGGELAEARAAVGLGPRSRVLLFCTEGATDPAAYEAIVGPGANPAG